MFYILRFLHAGALCSLRPLRPAASIHFVPLSIVGVSRFLTGESLPSIPSERAISAPPLSVVSFSSFSCVGVRRGWMGARPMFRNETTTEKDKKALAAESMHSRALQMHVRSVHTCSVKRSTRPQGMLPPPPLLIRGTK